VQVATKYLIVADDRSEIVPPGVAGLYGARALDEQEFKVIFLDHDLHLGPVELLSCESWGEGLSEAQLLSGKAVEVQRNQEGYDNESNVGGWRSFHG